MDLPHLLLTNLALAAGMFVCLWMVSLWLRDASVVDPFWSLAFVLIAWNSCWTSSADSTRSLLLVVLVTLWGIRLAGYLFWRNWGKDEDYRYAAMRQKHGERFAIVSLVTVFLLQAFLAWVISLPLQTAAFSGNGWSLFTLIGLPLWVVGVTFESVGDYQLARFKADPTNRGQVLKSGLWRYTRHPNYFGDFLVWWGLYLVAATPETWWWTLIGPMLMSFLLIRVSGVALLESSLKTRVDGYDQYVRCTSPFFPMPPKRLETLSE